MAGWQFENNVPIYQQIIDKISMDIAKGTLGPGDKLPAVRNLAAEAGVTPNTVQRALTALEEKGLVYARRTSGRFVTEDAERIQVLRKNMTDQIISDFFQNLTQLGMSRDDIIAAVSGWHENGNDGQEVK